MDDLQWADTGSLTLLRSLATAPDLRHVLLLGTYRSKELEPAHRLTQALAVMQAAGSALHSLELPPLDLRALTWLCRDTFHRSPRQVRPSAVAERSVEETAGALWSAIQEGLLVPESQGPRFARGVSRVPESPTARAVSYRFVHDRIQQAVYSLLSDEEKRHIHRQVGRRLLEGVSEQELDERPPRASFTYASTWRLPPHLTQTNTSSANSRRSSPAWSKRGVRSF